MWYYQESWQIQIKQVFDGEPAGILPELSTCAWTFYKQLNPFPENPTFKAFGSPGEFYGWLQKKESIEACRKSSNKEKKHETNKFKYLNLFHSRVLLLILYWCCFKQILHLKLPGRIMRQHRRCFVTSRAAAEQQNF